MDNKKTQQNKGTKKKSNIAGFLPFAIFVFAALAVSLIIILIRSRA